MATDGAEEKKETSDGFNRMMMRRPVAPELTLARLDPISLRRYLQKRVEFVNRNRNRNVLIRVQHKT